MRVTLLISSLATAGGAERVLSCMANYWAEQGAEVSLVTIDSAEHNFYPLHGAVARTGLGQMADSAGPAHAVAANASRIRGIRRALIGTRPDIVVSFIDTTNVLAIAATQGLSIPVVVSERVNPIAHPIPAGWRLMRRALYPRSAALVVQTHGLREWARRFVPDDRIHVVPNAVTPMSVEQSGVPKPNARRTAVAMGRLAEQKGFDLLLEAFERSRTRRPNDRLIIIGEGPARAFLEKRITELRLNDAVSLPGTTSQPSRILGNADVFVLSSRYEGFPNALLEAMAAGLPVISFDCPYGPSDIITHEVDGLLVPNQNVPALAAALDRMLSDAELRNQCAQNARDVTRRYSMDGVMRQWNSVLSTVLRKRKQT